MIDPGHPRLSIVRQCELVSISRAAFYRRPAGESEANLALMRLIDEAFLEAPWYGARQMARHLRRLGWCVGRKRVRRLMGLPYRAMASSSAATQKSASMVFDSRQARTLRLAQSMTATR